ncbi:MAG: hypothetical protein EXR86_14605 [Gammaproteobacteria bacterium]|nr:hypothetical protein [Gammaproteobacteria bacterium]
MKRRHHWSFPSLCLAAVIASLLPAMNVPAYGLARVFEYRYTLAAHVMSAMLLADLAIRLTRIKLRERLRVLPRVLVLAYLGWAVTLTASTSFAWRSSLTYWHWNTELYPAHYAAHYYAGKAAQQLAKYELAIGYFEGALKFNWDRNFAVYRRLGDSLYERGDHYGAKKYWGIYYRKFPDEITGRLLRRFETIGLSPPTQ